VIWIVALLGIAFPAFGTFLLSFVPLPSWVDRNLVRLAMLVAACVIPAIVGLVALKMMEPGQRPKGAAGKTKAILKGYPYTFGLAMTLILMTVFAPIMKVRNVMRRWTSEHVPVIIKPEDYRDVVGAVETALREGGIATTRHRASAMLRLPTRILTLFAGGAIANLVADEMTELRNDDLQVLAHPSDIVISGRELVAASARAVLAERLTFSKAYLTWDKEANEIEDALRAIWSAQIENAQAIDTGLARLADVERRMHEQADVVLVDRVGVLAWLLAAGLGAADGAVISPITYATYDMGLMLGLKGFVAAVLGGLVSPPAAIVGGFLLGVLESLAAGLVSSAYKDAVAFVVLIVLCLAQAAGALPWRVAGEA